MIFTIDREKETAVLSDVCSVCKHWDSTLARTCAAFPKGIPLEIWNGENDHAQEFPGDNGIRFEPFVPTANARAGEL